MQRLVYSPKVYAFVRTDSGMRNISDYIVSGSVERKVNMVSSAELTIRNPDMIWTKGVKTGNPIFRPMDPITIYLQRVQGAPVQAFTGYLDQTPYLQLYPGVCTLRASCTLKRLQHTYWDPALQFTADFLQKYGWKVNRATGTLTNAAAELHMDQIDKILAGDDSQNMKLDDGSIGKLLYAVLVHVGGWHDEAIHIESLPEAVFEKTLALYDAYREDSKEVKAQLGTFFKAYIGNGKYGGGGASGTSNGSEPGGTSGEIPKLPASGKYTICQLKQIASTQPFPDINEAAAIMYAESDGDPNVYNGICCHGLWQINLSGSMASRGTPEQTYDPAWATKWAYGLYTAEPKGWNTNKWEAYGNAKYQAGLAAAKKCKLEPKKDKDDEASRKKTSTRSVPATTSSVQAVQASRTGNERSETLGAPDTKTETKIYAPIKGAPPMGSGANSDFGWRPGMGRNHWGIDVPCAAGTPCVAPFRGKVTVPTSPGSNGFGGHGGMIHLEALDDSAGMKKGEIIGWGHIQSAHVTSGVVDAGKHIADSGWHHVHFVHRKSPGGSDGTHDPAPIYKSLSKGEKAPSGSAGGGSSGGGADSGAASGVGWEDVLSASKAAAFVQEMEFPGQAEALEAFALTGDKALLNDKPLLPFIEQLSGAAMRSFQSLPNGDFYAFYPDYFGHDNHRKPYWTINDIEILDAQIELSDEALATHVFAVGNTLHAPDQEGVPAMINRMATNGVVNIYNVVQSGFSPNPGDSAEDTKKNKKRQEEMIAKLKSDPRQVIQFLEKYGARPHVEDAPLVKNQFYEAFLAYHMFNLLWSQQFLTEIQTTFMPELFPGGLVEFAGHDLQCYIDSVTHTFDYESGFTTQTVVKAPSSTGSKIGTDPLSHGMVRAYTQK